MMLSKRVIESLIFTVVSSLPFMSALVLLPFYSNNLSTEDFGRLNVYISISLLFQVITSVGVEQYVPILLNDSTKNSDSKKLYYSRALGLQLIAGLVIIGVFFIIGKAAFQSVFPAETLSFWPFGLMSIATGFFNGYFRTQTTHQTYQQERSKFYFSNIFNFIFTVALSILFLYLFGKNVMGPLMGRLVSGVLIFLLALYFQSKDSLPRVDFKGSKEIVVISSTMFGYTFLMWLLNYVDRFIITNECTMTDVAIYDFAAKCLSPVEFLLMGLGGFILPKIYSSWGGDYMQPPMSKAKTLLHSYLVASVFGVIACMVGIPIIAPWFVKNPELYQSFSLLGIIGISFFTRTLFSLYMGILMLRKEPSRLVYALFYSSIIHVFLLVVLVPKYGLLGAVLSVTLGKVFSLIFLYWQLRARVDLDINYQKMIAYPALVAMVLIASFVSESHIGYVASTSGAALLSVLLTLFFFRKDLERAKKLLFEN
ncbi:MAG: oligosaccharide flippase family protein [Flavobacteriales bacterium]|jgi:O-antigen/teichoic acid export membrane protein